MDKNSFTAEQNHHGHTFRQRHNFLFTVVTHDIYMLYISVNIYIWVYELQHVAPWDPIVRGMETSYFRIELSMGLK